MPNKFSGILTAQTACEKVKGRGSKQGNRLRHLWHGEAQLGQLDVSDQWDGDAIGQHQVAVDNVLDDAVGEAAAVGGMGAEERGGGGGGLVGNRMAP